MDDLGRVRRGRYVSEYSVYGAGSADGSQEWRASWKQSALVGAVCDPKAYPQSGACKHEGQVSRTVGKG